MSEKFTDEEICKQLLELAQTPEQVRYLTGNNQAVLENKVKEYERHVHTEEVLARELRIRNEGKEKAYLKVIFEIINRYENPYDYD